MWLILSLLSLLAFAAADMLGKKNMDSGSETAQLEMLVSYEAMAIVTGAVLWALGLGESGHSPWQLIAEHPLLWATQLTSLLYWLLFLFSMRYVGLSMEEAVSGAFGVFYFVGLLVVSLLTGRLSAVSDMLHPLRLVPIILVLLFSALLPNTEVIAQKRVGNLTAKTKAERRRVIVGLLILLLGTAFDSADSLVVTLIFDGGSLGTVDYIIASQLINAPAMIVFLIMLRVKRHRWFVPFVHGGKYALGFAVFMLLSMILYMFSASMDAVRTGIIFIAYPIVPIIGAQILLKERYSWRQALCIWVITLSSIAFCIADYLL